MIEKIIEVSVRSILFLTCLFQLLMTFAASESQKSSEPEEPEQVREMIEVFETREEIEKDTYPRKLVAPVETVCMTPSEYHGLITAIVLLMILLFSITLVSGLAYR